ncbi:hypothetical protein ACVWWN_003458 [Mycobacterium sp. URHB0021]|jgi:hypothetical protein
MMPSRHSSIAASAMEVAAAPTVLPGVVAKVAQDLGLAG